MTEKLIRRGRLGKKRERTRTRRSLHTLLIFLGLICKATWLAAAFQTMNDKVSKLSNSKIPPQNHRPLNCLDYQLNLGLCGMSVKNMQNYVYSEFFHVTVEYFCKRTGPSKQLFALFHMVASDSASEANWGRRGQKFKNTKLAIVANMLIKMKSLYIHIISFGLLSKIY